MNLIGQPERLPIVLPDEPADLSGLVARAMTSARSAQARWARSSVAHRVDLLRELRRQISVHGCRLAETSASGRARPMLESLTAEVLPLAEACRFLEREAGKILAARRLGIRGRPLWLAGVRSKIHRDPVGVVLIVGPGNYPLFLPGVQLIQALIAGNAVLLKPGTGGAAAACALVELIVRAGFDPHLVTVLPETTEAVHAAIAARPDKVLFTGSAATGKKILAQLAPHLIPATMELSGSDPVIIRADADLELVVKALTFGLTLNGGATCMAPKRVFVARSIATELEGRLADSFCSRRESESHGWSESQRRLTTTAADTLRLLLEEALAGGAHFIAGTMHADGSITVPLVLGGVSASAQLLHADVFSPVLALITVANDDEAVRGSNDSRFALGASIFTRNESMARGLAGRLNSGTVTINDLIVPTADARLPFGGRGHSGFGVTRGAEGLLELTTPKVVSVNRRTFRPAFDPPHSGDGQMFESYLRLTHGRRWKTRWAALVTLIRNIVRRKKPSNQKKI